MKPPKRKTYAAPVIKSTSAEQVSVQLTGCTGLFDCYGDQSCCLPDQSLCGIEC